MVRTHDINGNLLKKIEDCDLNSPSLILRLRERIISYGRFLMKGWQSRPTIPVKDMKMNP